MKKALWLAVLVMGCGVQEATLTDDGLLDDETTADAPLLGADGKDGAERDCNLVLRTLERGATSCTTGLCWWTFTGFLDVSTAALAEGVKPKVLYKNIDATTWASLTPTKTTGAPAGFTRYRFRLTRNTVRDGMSATAYSRANVQVAPYLLTTTGARLFDHNRVPGDFDAYVVNQASGWKVADDAAVCRGDVVVPRGLDFLAGFRTQPRGALVAGQSVTLTYDLSRLPDCRGTHNGYPAWDLRAFVRFLPSGEVVDGSVRGFDAPTGVPNNANQKSVPYAVTIPAGTTGLEVWFKNFTGAGSSCVAWDSNLGANYRFPVSATPPARVEWVGNAGSSFSRACSRADGAPAEVTLDSYLHQRACAFVDVDVWVPGLTDAGDGPSGAVMAQVEASLDGAPLPVRDLAFVGRVGNDWRFRFEVPKSELYYGPRWQRFEYGFRFSTDGRAWKREATRAVVRDASFCNPAWGGC